MFSSEVLATDITVEWLPVPMYIKVTFQILFPGEASATGLTDLLLCLII